MLFARCFSLLPILIQSHQGTMKLLLNIALLLPITLAFTGNGVAQFSKKPSPFIASKKSPSLQASPMSDANTNAVSPSDRRSFLHTSAAALLAVAAGTTLSPQTSQAAEIGGRIQYGSESIMESKEHGTSAKAVQDNLLYGVDKKLADRICSYNRRFAEAGGYFQSTGWEKAVLEADGPVTFYDSVTGKPLFVAPVGRSAETLIAESRVHGWPSFRDQEVVWDSVRVIRNSGETVSVDGTHLGHNLPDRTGNRYCINLVCIAGQAATV